MPKEIIINHTHHETRVAMMEDGVLTFYNSVDGNEEFFAVIKKIDNNDD